MPFGESLAPHIQSDLGTDDNEWKMWVLQYLVAQLNTGALNQLQSELNVLADQFDLENQLDLLA